MLIAVNNYLDEGCPDLHRFLSRQRLSILGLWSPDSSFEYALKLGSFKGDSYIQVMDWIASLAAEQLQNTGRLTIVVQDNGSSHTCQQVQSKWSEWQSKGLFIFFLPKYCSEMNPIEGQWHQSHYS